MLLRKGKTLFKIGNTNVVTSNQSGMCNGLCGFGGILNEAVSRRSGSGTAVALWLTKSIMTSWPQGLFRGLQTRQSGNDGRKKTTHV